MQLSSWISSCVVLHSHTMHIHKQIVVLPSKHGRNKVSTSFFHNQDCSVRHSRVCKLQHDSRTALPPPPTSSQLTRSCLRAWISEHEYLALKHINITVEHFLFPHTNGAINLLCKRITGLFAVRPLPQVFTSNRNTHCFSHTHTCSVCGIVSCSRH